MRNTFLEFFPNPEPQSKSGSRVRAASTDTGLTPVSRLPSGELDHRGLMSTETWLKMRIEAPSADAVPPVRAFPGKYRQLPTASDGQPEPSPEPPCASASDVAQEEWTARTCESGVGSAETRSPPPAPHQGQQQQPSEGTTVMIRNIACRYTQKDVMQVLDDEGLAGTYDFIFVPVCPSRRSNRGYAFANFRTPGHAELCKKTLTGRTFGSSGTDKLCAVTMATIQGRENIVHHARRAGSRRDDSSPILVGADGVSCVDFATALRGGNIRAAAAGYVGHSGSGSIGSGTQAAGCSSSTSSEWCGGSTVPSGAPRFGRKDRQRRRRRDSQ